MQDGGNNSLVGDIQNGKGAERSVQGTGVDNIQPVLVPAVGHMGVPIQQHIRLFAPGIGDQIIQPILYIMGMSVRIDNMLFQQC